MRLPVRLYSARPPVTSGDPRQHAVDEVRRSLDHPAAHAARAEAAALAGQRHETLGAARRTAEPGEPLRQHAAAEEAIELSLDEGGQGAVVALFELRAQGGQALRDHAVQDSALGIAASVGPSCPPGWFGWAHQRDSDKDCARPGPSETRRFRGQSGWWPAAAAMAAARPPTASGGRRKYAL